MEEVRRIADETTTKLDDGTCFVYSLFHIFTEVIRVCTLETTALYSYSDSRVSVAYFLRPQITYHKSYKKHLIQGYQNKYNE